MGGLWHGQPPEASALHGPVLVNALYFSGRVSDSARLGQGTLAPPEGFTEHSAGLASGSLLGSPRNEEGAAPVSGSSSGSHRVWRPRGQVLCDPELQEQPQLQCPGRRFRSGAGLLLLHLLLPFPS